MNTLTNPRTANAPSTSRNTKSLLSESQWNLLEARRFAVVPTLLIIIACVGGVAAAFGTGGSTIQLALIVFPTMVSLAFILGVAPMKSIVYLCAASIVLDIFVLLF